MFLRGGVCLPPAWWFRDDDLLQGQLGVPDHHVQVFSGRQVQLHLLIGAQRQRAQGTELAASLLSCRGVPRPPTNGKTGPHLQQQGVKLPLTLTELK